MSQKPKPKPLIGDWHGFYNTIEEISNSNAPVPSKCPPLSFEFNFDTAAHKFILLEAVNYDLGKFIDQHPGSTISYSSEQRPLHKLENLLRHHPTYERFATNYGQLIDYPLKKLDQRT